jgi:hydrogenase maturation protein HypF
MSLALSAERGSTTIQRWTITVEGVVQGIGFRPFVHRLALRHALAGCVRNGPQGVIIDAEGDPRALGTFLDEVTQHAAARGGTARVSVTSASPRGRRTFAIEPSISEGVPTLTVVPDLATCEDCRREAADPRDRRRGYPFITCAVCGPRFTIVRALPYDRERTTMAQFAMCPRCRSEYDDPSDRRFHAETTACPACGPRLTLRARDGTLSAGASTVDAVAEALRRGAVVAIKGIGGYHVACDATNEAAVAALRRRKGRPAKPLAVMVADLAAASALGRVSDEEASLLMSPARPIVLVEARPGSGVAPNVAPRCRDLGVMLPYTPLHHLLLDRVARPLVMTSGNASDEPIAHRDCDAVSRLGGVADLILAHDRPIHLPCDDSVARVIHGVPRLIRRARGYVPAPVPLPIAAERHILACGGELKSAIALVRGREAFLSQHLGDLTNELAFRGFLATIEHFVGLLRMTPDVIAHDLHPSYRSTLYAQSLDHVEHVPVQHHHAHIASCLADNGVDRRVIGVAWDGTGYGVDGRVWGGEFLVADLDDFSRVGHFELVPLPGGDAAIREPWRMAGAFLHAAYGEAMTRLDLDFVRRLDRRAWRLLERAIASGLNTPLTSSAGRLFDAVANLLGGPDRVAYEAQAAMELEALGEPDADRVYAVALDDADGPVVVRTTDIVRAVVEDLLHEAPPARIAARFHATLADVIARVCAQVRARTGLAAVALSGGVFQNGRLLTAAVAALEARGFEVYTHRRVPANDGGLALGQAAVAARRFPAGAH